ncbi:hypothetical protein JWG40_03940 [Leptospira sp. 201903074]|uniref:hypothetical protein n=1 Tax=Leptospira abararensis TaxID=2810036 RepID=UPI0019630855|nr:hypothetical protein [Leptospira abararensis]MBM9546152.1 hypothetical protein [Leptospira abararensis]
MLLTTKSLVGYENVSYENRVVTPAGWAYVPAVNTVHFARDGWGNLFVGDVGLNMLGAWTIPCECLVNGLWLNGQIDATPWPWASVSPDPVDAREWKGEVITWTASGNLGYKTLAEWNSLQADVTAGTKRNLVGTAVYS